MYATFVRGLSKSNDYELSFDKLKHTIKGFIKTKKSDN